MLVRPRGLVQGLLALVVAAACGSDSSVGTISATPTPTAQATSNPTPRPSATPQATPGPPSPTPHAVLDDHFGFLVYKGYANDPLPGPIGWKVRRESDPAALYTLHTGSAGDLRVSPDGRRIAYWSATQLRVLDIAPTSRPRTLATVTATGEYPGYLVWSSDGTGLAFGVIGGGGGHADAPPGYTALRVVNIAGGGLREIVRITNADVHPLTWDRRAHLIAAQNSSANGTNNFYTVTEDGTLKRVPVTSQIYFPQASDNAQLVFAQNLVDTPPPFGSTTLLRVWPANSFTGSVDLRSAGGENILAAQWRPGSTEIAVLFANRVELWTTGGTPRALKLPAFPAKPAKALLRFGMRFRTDGSAVIVDRAYESGTNGSYSDGAAVAVNLATGVIEEIEWTGPPNPGPGTPVRIDTAQ